jgi:Protein of unknown function (DUF4239)
VLLDWIYNTSPFIVALCFGVTSVAVSSIGVLTSYTWFRKETRARHGELISFTVTNIAVLYAVLLAFIAVATWENFVNAQDVVESEANYAEQVFEDANGFTEPAAGRIRDAVTQYLEAVIQQEWPAQQHGEVPETAHRYLDQIHDTLAEYEPANAGKAVLMQELVRDLNRLFGERNSRLQAVNGHIPGMVWSVIIAVGALTIGYSCFMRAEGRLIHLVMVGGLTLALTLVVCLIIELDYPFRGMISVSAATFEEVLKTIRAHAH